MKLRFLKLIESPSSLPGVFWLFSGGQLYQLYQLFIGVSGSACLIRRAKGYGARKALRLVGCLADLQLG